MTFDPRARAKELARNVLERSTLFPASDADVAIVAERMLAFAREVLTQKPDEGMVEAGDSAKISMEALLRCKKTAFTKATWAVMATVLAKSLEDGGSSKLNRRLK